MPHVSLWVASIWWVFHLSVDPADDKMPSPKGWGRIVALSGLFSKKKLEKDFGWWEIFKIFHYSKRGPFNSKWLDLPRNTVMKNTLFFPKKLEKNLRWWEMLKILHFSKGGRINSEWLDLPRNNVIKNTFFFKNLKKFWVMRNVQNFSFFKGGSIRLRMTWFA